MLQLTGLYRYPLKSCAAEAMQHALIDELGLHGDRRWLVVDTGNGRFLTQRLLPQLGRIKASWQGDNLLLEAPAMPALPVLLPDANSPLREVTVWSDSLQVPDAGDVAARWVSNYLQRDCRLVQVPAERARQVDTGYAQLGERVGFADGFPLLLIGQSSLDDLSVRVGRPLEMLRFRPNLVIAGSAPYAEDSWKRIRIGTLELRVVKACSRCIMTTLDPHTGERSADREPLQTLKSYREHDGAVNFGQNLIAEGQGMLECGMSVEVLE